MIGTTKQVAWATKIRATRITDLEAIFAVPTTDEVRLANRAKILAALHADAFPAKLYIDSRHYDARGFAQRALNALNAAGKSCDTSELRMCEMAALKDRILSR